MSELRLTPEQQRAVDRREGRLFLHAGAGSGKTRVLVERFVRAVLDDGVAVESILAITFTEKAAAELKSRIRKRFLELGERERAREAEGAYISTIHGFCARLLRSYPLSAGIDPEFRVLDDPESGRIAIDAFDAALEAFLGDGRDPERLDVAAAYNPDGLREMTRAVHARLRSRGQSRPRLEITAPPAPAGERDALDAALGEAEREIGSASGKTVGAAFAAITRCRDALARVPAGEVGLLRDFKGTEVKPGNTKALKGDAVAALGDARRAWLEVCAKHQEHRDYLHLAQLLELYDGFYIERKAERSGLDFEDLQLAARDLLSGQPGLRDAVRARYVHVMVDEYQDTNPLQRELLELVSAGNLFTVGDAFQSIYLFRDADVRGFADEQEKAAQRGEDERLAVSFRSRRELLDAFNTVFRSEFGESYVPLSEPDEGARPGRTQAPAVELLLVDEKKERWVEAHGEAPFGEGMRSATIWRAAEARLLAARIRELAGPGGAFKPGEVALLVRAGTDLWAYERALEELGLPTYVVGGRGYWGQQQVADLRSWLAALANPRDELAIYTVLASPLVGTSLDALALIGAREDRWGPWRVLGRAFGPDGDGADGLAAALSAADQERLERFFHLFSEERAAAPRSSLEAVIDRAVTRTDYDRRVLAMPSGARRMANVRKLMRLAREYELDEGRDLRGFIDYVDEQDLVQAREAEAPLEGEDLDSVRLMTIHAAKGLEFPCVCVADLGRNGHGDDDALRVTRDGRMGLKMASLHGTREKSPEYERIQAESEAELEQEERRVFYVAMTRAMEHLVLSGGTDLERLPGPKPLAEPATWVWRALWPGMEEALASGDLQGETPTLRYTLATPANFDQVLASELWQPGAGGEETAEVAGAPPEFPQIAAARPLPVSRLSYSALAGYDACAYRFYVERVLRLPRPDPRREAALRAAAVEEQSGQFSLADQVPEAAPAPEPRLAAIDRGSVVHELLERLDFGSPVVPEAAAIRELLDARGLAASDGDVESVRVFISAFVESELRERIALARTARREVPFVFTLPPAPGRRDSLLVNGVMDVHAVVEDGTALVLDYKTDPVGEAGTEALVGGSYATQRLVYALAALRAGAERVEVVHLFLERPTEPAVQVFTAADAPALEADLQGLAAGLVNWQFTPSTGPHRGLCATCAARPGLCSWDEDRTLADLGATVAG